MKHQGKDAQLTTGMSIGISTIRIVPMKEVDNIIDLLRMMRGGVMMKTIVLLMNIVDRNHHTEDMMTEIVTARHLVIIITGVTAAMILILIQEDTMMDITIVIMIPMTVVARVWNTIGQSTIPDTPEMFVNAADLMTHLGVTG